MDRTLSFDEQNKLSKKKTLKAIDFEEYFGEMELDKEQIEERIELAKRLESVFLFLFALVMSSERAGLPLDSSYLISSTMQRFNDAVSGIDSSLINETYIQNYVSYIVNEIVSSTIENATDEYYTSPDRAKFAAENEANSILNYRDMQSAIARGMNAKRWITEHDLKVRKSHNEVGQKELPIREPFDVGNSKMMFPKDVSLGAEAKEIINCRCSIFYFYDSDFVSNEETPIRKIFTKEEPQLRGFDRSKTDEYVSTFRNSEIHSHRELSTQNGIYVSDNSAIKPKALHEIDKSITLAKKILGISENSDIPKFVVVSQIDLLNANVPGVYNRVINTLSICDLIGDKSIVGEVQKGFVFPQKTLSTIIHELLHWKDAIEYASTHENGDGYLQWVIDKSKKELDKIIKKGYDVFSISDYASVSFLKGRYDETYTEYRVLKLLEKS